MPTNSGLVYISLHRPNFCSIGVDHLIGPGYHVLQRTCATFLPAIMRRIKHRAPTEIGRGFRALQHCRCYFLPRQPTVDVLIYLGTYIRKNFYLVIAQVHIDFASYAHSAMKWAGHKSPLFPCSITVTVLPNRCHFPLLPMIIFGLLSAYVSI